MCAAMCIAYTFICIAIDIVSQKIIFGGSVIITGYVLFISIELFFITLSLQLTSSEDIKIHEKYILKFCKTYHNSIKLS